ncbi:MULTISPECIES: ATP-binding cassette domain-containing protein [unclassified Capnocytophaga]|jgi:ABC-type multidrug transport system, ATPase component|uniref:ATP-binding cassette domain-containing protein n=1 Tax=unclassified Capnocytophaga TaxID=2640652 RepID=UPI000202FB2B|nr:MULTISPECIES: ATP-binding cassette domain-containing protein [unclassified Capnocytophaga]EGD35336.1 gliding motility-associated ABC superfamily ATP binding cassette transporter, ABC protein [Capnocytophaga sp. oral taxon 338 str. F0234]MEB3005336.1 ATP-binding cassette domain-containing protein [Capnocytophaga sp. G2]
MAVIVENLTKSYPPQKVVDHISFELHKGEVTGFLGLNGAGKTTTMKMMTGALLPDEGTVNILGYSILTQREQAQKHIGYLPEHNPLYLDMYIKEYLQYVADIYHAPKSRIEDCIALTSLESHAHKKIYTLSKGYRQRVGLASTLLHDPDILILDEPTNGLDPQQILEIRQIIKDLGKDKVVLLSSHIMQEIQAVCQRVLILHKGKIILDEQMKHLQDKEQTIEILFDYRVEEQLLRRIPHIKTITNNEGFFFTLTFDTQEDMRSKLFDFALENGLKILQMNHKHTDLEQLFTELTKND